MGLAFLLTDNRLIQICEQVFERLDAHRQPDQAVRHSRPMPRFGSHPAVAGHRRPRGQALHAAQTHRVEDQLNAVEKSAGGRFAPGEFKREQ